MSDTQDDAVDGKETTTLAPLHLLLDAGYGIPREARPRQEKILAIAKQIANFLEWQLLNKNNGEPQQEVAAVTVVGCDTQGMKEALLERLEKLWSAQNKAAPLDKEEESTLNNNGKEAGLLPPHFSFARDEEHSKELLQDAVYLSPDAPSALNPSQPPPAKVIVGLLIDRRVQLNRSLTRSEQLELSACRWPMETLEEYHHPQEPLNVDTILEALQQWTWNYGCSKDTEDDLPFLKASIQAFRHHEQRHPARPKHRHN